MTIDELDALLARVNLPGPRRRQAAPEGPHRVIGYCRVSTEEQTASGLGVEAQRAAIAAEVARRDWTMIEVVTDQVGGGTPPDERPGLSAAMDTLKAGEADALVVARLDRLSRSMSDFLNVTKRSRREGWAVAALDVNVDTSTPAGSLMVDVLMRFSEYERDLIRARTREALAAKKAQGIRMGRPRLISDSVTRLVLQERAKGKTLKAIGDLLTRNGIHPPAGGLKWYPSRIRAIILGAQLDADAAKARDVRAGTA